MPDAAKLRRLCKALGSKMLVSHIIDDLEFELNKNSDVASYKVAFANYCDDGSRNIELTLIEAFDWDEDEEFFLIPKDIAKHYDLEANDYTVQGFLDALKAEKEDIAKFDAYARAKTKIAGDGTVASINSPLWGTGIHNEEELIYFYHGDQPQSAT